MASLQAAKIHGVAKASWMQRQSSILGRWKYNFCVLYRNGKFAYFADEKQTNEQDSILIPHNCYAVNAGAEVVNVAPPTGRDKSCLLGLRSYSANVVFCADSIDDCISWKSAILEVKAALMPPAPAPLVAQPMAPAYVAAPPPYSQVVLAPPVVVTPGYGSSTYTVQTTSLVQPVPNEVITVNGNGSTITTTTSRPYPVQRTVYNYPRQTVAYTYQQPGYSYVAAPPTVVYTQQR